MVQHESTFTEIIDKLNTKSEQDLKFIYTRLFSEELAKEQEGITNDATFQNISEDDIIKAVRKIVIKINNAQNCYGC